MGDLDQFSKIFHGQTAITVHFEGFSLFESGRMMPDFVTASSKTGSTKIWSSRGISDAISTKQ
jgi:hypothetical protein